MWRCGRRFKVISDERMDGVAMLVVASALWSLSGVAVKTIKLPPITFTLYRSLGAAIAMAAMVPLLRGRGPRAGWMGASAGLYVAVVTLLIMAMTLSSAFSRPGAMRCTPWKESAAMSPIMMWSNSISGRRRGKKTYRALIKEHREHTAEPAGRRGSHLQPPSTDAGAAHARRQSRA